MIKLNQLSVVIILCILFTAGCDLKEKNKNERPPENTEHKNSDHESDIAEAEKEEGMIFFKAQGNEPFWNLTLSEQQMIFTSLLEGFEEIATPIPALTRAADANIKRYRAATEKVLFTVTITHNPCSDTMADNNYEYRVAIELQLTGNTKTVSLQGCGNYNTDHRLQAIWVLEKLGEEKVRENWFAVEFPKMEVKGNENSFTGYGGCNQLRGTIFWEPGLLRFTDVISTRKACRPENKEEVFLNMLRKTTTYTIENNRLLLANPDQSLMVFRKTD